MYLADVPSETETIGQEASVDWLIELGRYKQWIAFTLGAAYFIHFIRLWIFGLQQSTMAIIVEWITLLMILFLWQSAYEKIRQAILWSPAIEIGNLVASSVGGFWHNYFMAGNIVTGLAGIPLTYVLIVLIVLAVSGYNFYSRWGRATRPQQRAYERHHMIVNIAGLQRAFANLRIG